MNDITLCVVIPTKNRPGDLSKALESVLSQTELPDEVVVMDQSATETGRPLLDRFRERAPGVTARYVFDNTLTGLTAAKNEAIRVSRGSVLLFIDDDIILDPDFIAILRATYRAHPEMHGVGGIARLPGKGGGIKKLVSPLFQLGPFRDDRALLQAGYLRRAGIIRTRVLSGGLSSLRREVFDRLRFNEELHGASPIEDMDFFLRASKHFSFCLAPGASALHNVSGVSRQGLARATEIKCLGFWFIFSRHIDKTPLAVMAYIWRNLGFLIDSLALSLNRRTLDPVRGLVNAWLRIVREPRTTGIS